MIEQNIVVMPANFWDKRWRSKRDQDSMLGYMPVQCHHKHVEQEMLFL